MWARKAAIGSSIPTKLWPQVNEDALRDDIRERFRAQSQAINLYFSNVPVREIQKRTGIDRTALPRLARKCLLLASDGNIFGFRALLPHVRVKRYERTAPVRPKFPEEKSGHAGVLGALFQRFPEIRNELIHAIRHEVGHRHLHEYRMHSRDLHRLFIQLIRKAGIDEGEWPFNTKHLGMRSIQKFMKTVLEQSFSRTVQIYGEQESVAHLSVGTGYEPLLRFEEPYEAVEIDAYSIESHLTVGIRTPEGTETDLLLERLWLVAAVERVSTAVLAYRVVYRSEVTADDVLGVIRDAATSKWSPKTLTVADLSYPEGSGLPSGVLPCANGAVWSATLLDGALAHLSKTIHERARKTIGFVINWGAVGHFERRPNVERTFNQIARDLFKRLPSTTGSHPHNGRAYRSEEKALRHRIRADVVEQLLDVTIAQHNSTPSEGTSFLTPLQVLRYFFEESQYGFLVRRLPANIHESAKIMALKETATVRGGRSTGRRPYVQIDRVHYTSPVLSNAGHLIGKQLVIEIDEDDMRQVRAYLSNGMELGYLKAKGKWSLSKHSRRTRKAINSLISQRIVTVANFDDPVNAYIKYLKKLSTSKDKWMPSPRQITNITRVAREAEKPSMASIKIAELPEVRLDAHRVQDVAKRSSIMERPISFFEKVKNRR